MSKVHKPAMMRSEDRRLGARFRPRFRIRTWCRIKTDSATTARSPPGWASRIIVTITCKTSAKMSRITPDVTRMKAREFRALVEFAQDTRARREEVTNTGEQ